MKPYSTQASSGGRTSDFPSKRQRPSVEGLRREDFNEYSRAINRSLYNLLMMTVNLANHLSYSALSEQSDQ